MTATANNHLETLRRLALNDEDFLSSVLAGRSNVEAPATREPSRLAIDDRTKRLIDLAALIAVGSGSVGISAAVAAAFGAGATDEDIVDVLLSIAPTVGSARLVDSAPHIAAAIGYDMDADFELLPGSPAARDCCGED